MKERLGDDVCVERKPKCELFVQGVAVIAIRDKDLGPRRESTVSATSVCFGFRMIFHFLSDKMKACVIAWSGVSGLSG
jgi:hypothetical protein